jgi:hypothetical protein
MAFAAKDIQIQAQWALVAIPAPIIVSALPRAEMR